MGAAIVPLMAAGTALQAYGAYKEGADTKAVDRYNAQVSDVEGQAAMQEALAQEQIKRGQNRAVMARQRVIMGSSGITGGTFEDVAAQSAQAGELDAMAIRMGGTLARSRAKAQGGLYKTAGDQAYGAGLLSGLTTVASGGTRTAQAYQQLNK